ncbi:MAG: alpha/beta hydrolase-fold protein [Jatrophihabitans sp.]
MLLGALVSVALLAAACTSANGSPSHAPGSTSSSARTSSSADTSGLAALTPAAGIATTGELIQRQIPGGESHFAARAAWIYLPPAAIRDKHLRLPVVELLHGTPGTTEVWFEQGLGNLLPTIEAFARAHNGQAPIVVMPDSNGARDADSECIRTPSGGNVEQYLTSVVPAWIATHLPATTNHRDWALAGLSEGGTCSLMLTLRHRSVFNTIGDFAGQAHLTLGEPDNHTRTVQILFDGSQSAYDLHDPLYLLTHAGSLRGLGIWMQSGALDRQSVIDQALLAPTAQAKGATVQPVLYPGLGHRWPVWTNAFTRMLPWWWQRMSA